MSSNSTGDGHGHDGRKGTDKALLDRLNALKPTNVTLESTSSTITPASTIERAKPPSREDALSDRLKNLRNQIGTHDDQPPASQPKAVAAGKDQTTDTTAPRSSTKHKVPSAPDDSLGEPLAVGGAVSAKKADIGETEGDNIEPLLEMTDDQTLEELLADLESDEQWVADVAAKEEDEQHRKAMALLKELSPGGPGAKGTESEVKDKECDDDSDDDDDSEGEEMGRETNDILAKAMEEAEFDKEITPSKPGPSAQLQNTGDNLQEGNGDESDFAASIATRMAALNVAKSSASSSSTTQLPSVPTSGPDPFAALLPSAPTFSPTKSSSSGLPGGIKRIGYTDEDQKSWCTVCLEDGAIRCVGCDGDIYCARCWKEMHVGPRAGFDERGHKWEKYDRRRD